MNKKIITLIIGMLIGAVITAGIFLLINKNKVNSFDRDIKSMPSEMREGNPGENSNGKGEKNKTRENTTEKSNTESQETTNSNTTE